MSCLFCGKEIGPLRLLRKEEFCSSAHRRLYKERLGKVLGSIGAPEPPPAPRAGFQPLVRSHPGRSDSIVHLEFLHTLALTPASDCVWPLAIPAAMGSDRPTPLRIQPVKPRAEYAAPPSLAAHPNAVLTAAGGTQLPLFEFAVEEELERLAEVAALNASELGGVAPPLAAEPAARWVAAVALAEPVEARVSAALPELRMAVSGGGRPALCGAARGAAPAADRRPDRQAVIPFHQRERLPRFEVAAECEPLPAPEAPRPPASQEWMTALAAMPVARWITASMVESPVSAAVLARLPGFAIDACVDPLPEPLPEPRPALREEWMTSPAAMPVARWITASVSEALTIAAKAEGPRFAIAAALDPLPAVVEVTPRPPMSEGWMNSPPAMPVARMVLAVADASTQAAAPAIAASLGMPEAFRPTLRLPSCPAFAESEDLEPEPALVNAFPSLLTDRALSGSVELPAMPPWQAKDAMRDPHAGPALSPDPEPVETWPTAAACEPVPTESTPRLCLPDLRLSAIPGCARLECSAEPDMAPRPALPAPAAARVVAPMFRIAAPDGAPLLEAVHMPTALALAGFVETEFHCRPTHGALSKRLRPLPGTPVVVQPRMSLRPAFERWEDLAPGPKKPPFSLGKVLTMPRAVRQVTTSKRTRHMVGTIAAGLFLGAALYFGATGGQQPQQADEEAPAPVVATEAPAAPAPAGHPSGGAFSRLRQKVADRAAASWTDSFHHGMESWGATSKSWAPGWTKSSDGYVQPGALAIFRPSSTYTNYQLEFFGQIEHSSMDWVVRAKDSQNYYAMKLKVVEAGLRPIVAMVHYNVTGGKRGRAHELPLNVMVHNGRPMQVLVDVRGNRFTASVDGQQVDTWTDSAPAAGGVGFFAEAGEKARLYWMRVSRNEDFIGRICAYFTGSNTTAELWPSDPYGRPGRGGDGMPGQPAPALSAAAIVTSRRRRWKREI